MTRNVVIIILCLLITGTMSIAPVSAEDVWTAKGAYDYIPYRLTRLFGNPGLSSGPDMFYVNDHEIHACWMETHDAGVFRPAYAKFDGYAWRNARGMDTHSLHDYVPHVTHPQHFNALSVSKILIAPSPMSLSQGPFLFARWNFPEIGISELFYLDVSAYPFFPEWKRVCDSSYADRSSFDICYDDDFIYVTWVEYDKKEKHYDIFVSRFDGTNWMKLLADTSVDPKHTNATILEGNTNRRLNVNIEVSPHEDDSSADSIPHVSWEEEGEIYIARWEPEIEPGRCGWVDLLGYEDSYTNVSDSPTRASHEPDFKLDPNYRPIVAWSEEAFTSENTLAIQVSKWSGGSWWTCDGVAGASFIPGTPDYGDATAPSLILGSEGKNPIITWNQYVSDTDYVSSLSIRGDEDWLRSDGTVGFELLRRYGEAFSSFITQSRPFRLPDNPSDPWNGDCDFAILGSIQAPEYWFAYPQTDIFYSRYSTSWPTVDRRLLLRATRNDFYSFFEKGWFPIDVNASDTSLKRVRFNVKADNIDGQYLYIRFNTLVKPIHVFGFPGYYMKYWNAGTSTWDSLPYPLSTVEFDWLRVPVSQLSQHSDIMFIVEYNHEPNSYIFDPHYFYTEAFTSDSDLSPDPPFNTYKYYYDEDRQYDFIGFNLPHDVDYVSVTPSTLYLNACDKQYERYTIFLQSPWGSDGFRYEFFLDNASELNSLEYFVMPASGQSDKANAVASVLVRAPCDAPATWCKPRLITKLTHPNYSYNYVFETDTVDLLVRKPVLSATKTASTSMAAIGDVVTYTIRVSNRGSGDAKGIIVSDVMPKELEFLHSNFPAMPNGNAYDFLIDVPGNNSVTIRIICRISSTSHLKAGDVITNMATVSGIDEPLVANMGITIKASNPGCETPEVELLISNLGRGNIIEAGREFDCQMIAHTGCNPMDAVVFWDDGSEEDRFEIDDDMIHFFTHTFKEPGDYLVRSTVSDPYGKMVNLYKHIHVVPAIE
jgi:uncharacterized repeat protein (TIGR01451 family)